MDITETLKYFGNQQAIAEALHIKPPAIYQWKDGIPPLRQIQIERLTNGALKADPACYGPAQQPLEQAA